MPALFQYNLTPPTVADGNFLGPQIDSRGNLNVCVSNGAASATVGTSSNDGQSQSSNSLYAKNFNYISNGATYDRWSKATGVSKVPSAAASVNATVAKAATGTLKFVGAYNTTASVKFVKIYNKATAPTVGTDTPVLCLPVPPNGLLYFDVPEGLYFSAGISYAMTGAAPDADATVLAAGDLVGFNLVYH